MTDGREVVEDYGHIGLTLRDHPLAFLREDLTAQTYETCAEAGAARDLKFVRVAGVVLVRQKPGSAKGVMFITLEDETAIANLVIWPRLYEENRRTILGASMLGVHGRIQREGEVVHLVAYKLFDLSDQLASVGGRDAPLKLRQGRGDEFAHGWSPDARDAPPKGMTARDIYIPDLHIDSHQAEDTGFQIGPRRCEPRPLHAGGPAPKSGPVECRLGVVSRCFRG
jgi:error-prone DNA polymerase